MRYMILAAFLLTMYAAKPAMTQETRPESLYTLPAMPASGVKTLIDLLRRRRSHRNFARSPVSLWSVGEMLWAAQGITSVEGYRTAPSAGGLYPLELFLVAGNVSGLKAGVYRYIPGNHALYPLREGDLRGSLSTAALGQEWVKEAAFSIVVTGTYQRTASKYGDRAFQYVHIEAGCAAQNCLLQAASSGLSSVIVGAFYDDAVQDVLNCERDEIPLAIISAGKPPE